MTQKYDREFKLEAIRMASEEGNTAVEVERRLGISQGIISRWKKQLKAKAEGAFPGTGHLSDSDEEIRRLRRELTRVSQERDILKKAAAFFANESR
jgi:transposase